MSSYDITFCSQKDCCNYQCKRNISNVKGYPYPVSMLEFTNCEYWGEDKNDK